VTESSAAEHGLGSGDVDQMVFAGAQVSWSGPELEQVVKLRGFVAWLMF